MGIEVKVFRDYDLDYERTYMGMDRLLEDDGGPKGWLNPTKDTGDGLGDLIQDIRQNADVFIVCGIGGSYLGARAVIDLLQDRRGEGPQIVYAGNSLNPQEIIDILDGLEGKSTYINVISKSGGTMETLVAFSILKDYMDRTYDNPSRRIIVTTGNPDGLLASLADKEGYRVLGVPDDVGGRYSVMTNVGFLPIGVAGIDIGEFLAGGIEGAGLFLEKSRANPAIIYSAMRSLMYAEGKDIEILVSYWQRMELLGEWYRQLFGESQGKDGKGIYPSSLIFTRDLHSMGQLIQEGRRNIFETVINFEKFDNDIEIPWLGQDDCLKGRSLAEINSIAVQATIQAHEAGGVPNILISLDRPDAYHLGLLMYFFMVGCAVNSYELGVNPFNQPGVEEYKKNIKEMIRD